ncbi:MAG: rhamnulokinase [Anaerolineaceae bacterium]|nr:rhamnulokinase [Anaerolineaceae bacterium]
MAKTCDVLAIDIGAESGRVMRIGFDGKRFHIDELHRFPNVPVMAGGTLYWDVLRLWHDIQTGIEAAGPGMAGLGIDTWGCDYALLDRDGELLGNPVHYRDSRNEGMSEQVFERVPWRTVYERTGIQFMAPNTLFQLAAMVMSDSWQLANADCFLPFPQLFNYWMTGDRSAEFTHVSTMQIYNPHTKDWDYETLGAIGVPTHIFGDIVPPGTRLGEFRGIPVFAPASHDTGSAVVGVPATRSDFAYLSSGTWSLLGLEIQEPIISEASFAANLTNEGGVEGTFRFLVNVMGLWLVQQCRATWAADGRDLDYGQLTDAARAAPPFVSLIDPDDDLFFAPGDMPARIREYCRAGGQPVPESVGAVLRCINESLALKYRYALDRLIAVSEQAVAQLHIIGGGSQNDLLNQMTADATGLPVVAGPVEATALGNAIVQFIALGEIANVAEARSILASTVGSVTFEPDDDERWQGAFRRFCDLLDRQGSTSPA